MATGKSNRPVKKTPPPPVRPAAKKPGKSIVNQKQTPWGLIATGVALALFAAAIIGYAVTRGGDEKDGLPEALAIPGVQYFGTQSQAHQTTVQNYPQNPPVGGAHAGVWADCTGTVYPNPIANENAVHSLEHGAVWIAYNPSLPAADVNTLKTIVNGNDRLLMSPYPGLSGKISLQSWSYQLVVDSPGDPRIRQFIDTLRYNNKTTPEFGATCAQPNFKANPSKPGAPWFNVPPAPGASTPAVTTPGSSAPATTPAGSPTASA